VRGDLQYRPSERKGTKSISERTLEIEVWSEKGEGKVGRLHEKRGSRWAQQVGKYTAGTQGGER